MVIEIVSGANPGEMDLLDQAFCLRHDVFVKELGWEPLRRADSREVDQFDDRDATHFLAIEKGKVVGYFRSRPTDKPHLLSDVHAHLCQRNYPRSANTVEWTRHCVSPAWREGGSFTGVRAELIVAGIEWGLHSDINDVVLEYHPAWIAHFMGLGFRVQPLGLPMEISGDPVVAVHMHFDASSLAQARRVRGVDVPVLSEQFFNTGRIRKSVAS